jgi:hypothetical protein
MDEWSGMGSQEMSCWTRKDGRAAPRGGGAPRADAEPGLAFVLRAASHLRCREASASTLSMADADPAVNAARRCTCAC